MKELLSITISVFKNMLRCCLFLFATLSVALAGNSEAQIKSVKEVTVNMDINSQQLEAIFKSIENQTGFRFFYTNQSKINKFTIDLSGLNSSGTVAYYLSEIARQTELGFRQVNSSISVLKPRQRQANKEIQVIINREISGKVINESGEAMPGASIIVKGTTMGTVTDIDGNFTLDVPDDKNVLSISFIGYATSEVEIGTRSYLEIQLEPDIQSLQEVVVVAYAEMDKRKFIGSAEFVDAEKIEQVPLPSIDNILQGQAPGLQVIPANGQPGGSAQVRIRGIGSISSGSAPLYVVDGVIIRAGGDAQLAQTSNVLASINPGDIESISVLKDASAAALYGSQAANGVILITTKRGKKGKPRFTFRTQHGISEWENSSNYDVMNSSEYLEYHREAVLNAGGDPDQEFLSAGVRNPGYFPVGADSIDTDWFDFAFQTGKTEQYELSASGGSETTSYYVNGTYFFQEGIARNTDIERFSTRINLDHNADKVRFGVNLSASRAIQHSRFASRSFNDPLYGGNFLPPTRSPFASAEQIESGADRGTGFNFDIPELDDDNTYAAVALNSNELRRLRFIGNIYGEVDLIKNLTLRTSLGVDWIKTDEDEFLSRNYTDGLTTNGEVDAASRDILTSTLTSTLRYDFSINNDHNFSALIGSEYQEREDNEISASAQQVATDKLRTLATAGEPSAVSADFGGYALWGLFSRLNYDFNNKYFAELSIRRDGSSRFGADTRFGLFWSAGVGYTLSEEDFFNIDVIDNLKFRGSYGVSGNQAFGDFDALANFIFNEPFNTIDGVYNGSRAARAANTELTWEENKSWNLGTTIDLVDSRIGLQVDYFHRTSTDLLLDVPISRTSGFNTFPDNIGEMENRGWEASLSTVNVQKGDFTWSSNLNFTVFKNEVTSLPTDSIADPGGDEQRIIIGQPGFSWFLPVWGGVNPATGEPLWFDANNNLTSNYGEAEFRVVGQSIPDFYGSFTNTLNYKGISLSFMFYFNYGNDIYREGNRFMISDGARFGRNQNREALQQWQKPGDITNVPRAVQNNVDGGNNHSTRYLEDGSFIRLRNVSVSYELPAKYTSRLKLENVRIFLQGQNLKTWTEYKGTDPENGVSGNDFGSYPIPRTMTVGLDINF